MLKSFFFVLILVEAIFVNALPTTLEEIEVNKNSNRIVGGHEVDIAKHPHQISLRRKSRESSPYTHSCGGSVYKANIIITAAHCVQYREAESFLVVAGTNIRNGADGAVSRVSKIIVHESYDSFKYSNDIALLILATPLPLNNITIAAVKLTSEAPEHGEKAVVTGWGTTSSGGYLSDTLLEVEVPIVSNERCDAAYAAYYGPGRITDSMLCAGVEGVGGKDACQGDSGGPLLVKGKLAGVVSWGIGCALPDYPGVYSNVAYLKKWIEKNAKKYA